MMMLLCRCLQTGPISQATRLPPTRFRAAAPVRRRYALLHARCYGLLLSPFNQPTNLSTILYLTFLPSLCRSGHDACQRYLSRPPAPRHEHDTAEVRTVAHHPITHPHPPTGLGSSTSTMAAFRCCPTAPPIPAVPPSSPSRCARTSSTGNLTLPYPTLTYSRPS